MKRTEQNTQELWDNYKRCNLCVMEIPEEKKEKGTEEIFEAIITENFSYINVRYQTTDTRSSEDTKQDKYHPPKNCT